MSRIKAYLELIRYPLFAIPIVATLPGTLIASNGRLTWRVVAALLIALFGYFAGMIKNDYFHRETDAYTNPNRPLPSHRLTPRQALVPASVIYATCVICGFLLSIKAGLLVMALVAISHLYNAFFKAKGVLGSLTLPLGIGLLNIFGALVVIGNAPGSIPSLVWYAFGATTLYDLGTHITTTFKDISRDEKHGIMTTPIQLGIRPALLLSAFATALAFAVALLPYWLEPLEQKTYAVWVILGLLAVVITRVPLYLRPTEKNGYFALKGSMIGSIFFFPCLIGAKMSVLVCSAVILPLLFVTMLLLRTSSQEV